jgi:TPP-dependent indolepyruvate ferredoxin oxidoreductase alpha subunit
MTQTETLPGIRQWACSTFGKATFSRVVERASEEMDELTETISLGCDELTVLEEAANVVITLASLPGLQAAINAKMVKNRASRWKVMGDGTGYHIKQEAPA